MAVRRRIAAVMQSTGLVVNVHLMDGDAMPVIRKGDYDLVEVPDEVAIGMVRGDDGSYAWPIDPAPVEAPAVITAHDRRYRLDRR
jgi:hypothetical protein